jgi:hypothetical protein
MFENRGKLLFEVDWNFGSGLFLTRVLALYASDRTGPPNLSPSFH